VEPLSRRDPEEEHRADSDGNERPPSHDQVHRKSSAGKNRDTRGDATLRCECHSLADGAENPATVDASPREWCLQ
jgi:hypothetical protein